MKKILIFCILFISIYSAKSQNDFLISQFFHVPSAYNPAFTGKMSAINVSLIARQQWVGFDGAPSTQYFNIEAQIFKRHGIGITVYNDAVGFEKSINVKLMYAYHLKITAKSNLSISAGIGVLNRTIDIKELKFEKEQEASEFNIPNSLVANFDFGLLYYNQKMNIGLSSKYLDRSVEGSTFVKSPRHYYLYADYKFNLGEKFALVPTLFVRSTLFATQFEINTNLVFKDKIWGGISYRSKDVVVLNFGLLIKKMFKIGYALDYSFGPIMGQNFGSHEIFAYYTFNLLRGPKSYYKNPRMFN